MKTVVCKRCGEQGLIWHQNKQGKWILVVPKNHIYESGTGYWIEPHKCQEIQSIRQQNIEVLQKQIESTKKIGAENGFSEEAINLFVAQLEEKIAIQKGWQ